MLSPQDHLLRRTSSATFDLPVSHLPTHASPVHTGGLTSPTSGLGGTLKVDADARDDDDDEFASSCVISGGTGGNAICHAFKQAAFVLPISDDGGSSSEILRCLGGPSIGDIRSRLIRLAPAPDGDESVEAIIRLLSHRLPSDVTEREAKELWRDVVEGTSALWAGISADRREVLHRFFVLFEAEILQRAHKAFSFVNCSLGNVFLASAQRFFLSLPAAIFLFASVTQSAARSAVLPAILTNQTATIAAELESGETIVGQCNISHPAERDVNDGPPPPSSPAAPSSGQQTPASRAQTPSSFGGEDGIDSGRGKTKLPAFKAGAGAGGGPKNLIFKRTGAGGADDEAPLESRIRRLFYINSYGQEIFPIPNPEVIQALSQKEVLVYSCGSLYTSLCPCLALNGMASAIKHSPSLRAKVLLLNTTNDRETHGYAAVDYVEAIVQTLNRYDTSSSAPTRKGSISSAFSMSALADAALAPPPPTTRPVRIAHSALISHVVCIEGCAVEVDEPAIEALGIKVVWLPPPESGQLLFDTQTIALAMKRVRRSLASP